MKFSFNLLRVSVWGSLFLLITNCGVDSKDNSVSSDLMQASIAPEIPLLEAGSKDIGFTTAGVGRSSTANVAVAVHPINQVAGEVILTEASAWVAEYFNNYQFDANSWPRVLPANPYAKPSQLANDLELKWGNASPAYGINSDYFSARFTSLIKVNNQGTLRFKFNSDDGSRAYIHSQHGSMVVGAAGQVNPTSYLNASDRKELWNHWREKAADAVDNDGQVYVYPGYYVITIEYYERAGGAELKFAAGSNISTPVPVACQANDYKASFYHGNFFGDTSAGAANLPGQPAVFQQCISDLKTGLKTELQQVYYDGQPRYDLANNYTAYYEKTLFVEKMENTAYRLEFKADDAMKVFIDGSFIAEHSLRQHGDVLQVRDIVLRPGAHKIVLKMLEDAGIASIKFKLEPIETPPPPPPPPVTVGPGVNDALLPDSCGGTNWTRHVIDGIGHKFSQGVWAPILEKNVCLNSPTMSINQNISGATMRTTYYARKLCCAATFNFQLRADDRAWIYVNGELKASYDLAIDRGNIKNIQISVPNSSTMVVVVEDDGGAGSLYLQRY